MSQTTTYLDQKFIDALSENMNMDVSFVLDWVEDNFTPEEVFDISALQEWAKDNGYINA